MQFVDIYILIKKYNNEVIKNFLNNYLRGFEQAADYYEFPQYSDDPSFETESIIEMLEHLIKIKKCNYALYWNNSVESEILNGMVFFCQDLSLIIGISVIPQKENFYRDKLKKDFNTDYCLSSIEEMPPLDAKEFIKLTDNPKPSR